MRFVDAASLASAHDPDDYFDAVHYIGATGHRVAARLSDDLSSLEVECRKARGLTAPSGE